MSENQEPQPVPAETKDWVAVLDTGCEQCGWQPFDPRETAARLSDAALRWEGVLEGHDVSMRPDPLVVSREIAQATQRAVAELKAVGADDWPRPGHRSDGVGFTLGSLCQFKVHEAEHHLWDAEV